MWLLASSLPAVVAAASLSADCVGECGPVHGDINSEGDESAMLSTRLHRSSEAILPEPRFGPLKPNRTELLLRCAQAPAGDAACFDTAPPPEFRVRFSLADGSPPFVAKVTTSWAPVFAQRFWQLSKLGWWKDVSIYRNVYVNTSARFVSQWGIVGIPSVDKAWTDNKNSNETNPALQSNTRGRLTFAMNAVTCDITSEKDDPCAPYRHSCTSTQYCAVGFTTEIFVNYADNSRLDANGFAPFGEVEGDGMATLDKLGKQLGREYGEVQEFCPEDPTGASPSCVYNDGQRAGVNMTTFGLEGNPYIKSDYPGIYEMRISSAEVL